MALIFDPNFDFSVIDESAVEAEAEVPSIDTSLGVLIAGFTSGGVKNKIVECRTRAALMEFGDDFTNFDKYGQANVQAMRVVRSGGRVFYCSLIPDDAHVAYSLFGVSIQENDNIPVYQRTDTVISEDKTAVLTYGTGSFVLDSNGLKQQIKLKSTAESETLDKLATVKGLSLTTETVELNSSTYFDKNGNPTAYDGSKIVLTGEDSKTRTFYPLFCFYSYSRGIGGNNFAYRVQRNTDRDKATIDGRRYVLNFFKLLSTGSYTKMFDGLDYDFSFNKDAVYSSTDSTSEALALSYINIDDNSEEKPIQLIVYEDSYENLINDIVASGASEEANKYDIDILDLTFKSNFNSYNKIVAGDHSIDVANTIITFDHGDDGSLQEGNVVNGTTITKTMVEKTKIELLTNFFTCDVDDDIFDEKITDIDILPDCNYPLEIKKTILSKFSTYREDIHLGMDLGICKSADEAISAYRQISSYVNSEKSYMVSFYGQAGYLKDTAVDGSPREITSTYDWVAGIASQFVSPGLAYQMRAGSGTGRVTYITPYWIAKKNKSNTIETLEELGINNIQYLNKARQQVYMLESTQYEVESSKLMSVRNSIVIGKIIRMCAGVLVYYKFDKNAISTTMESAKSALETNFKRCNIPNTISATFDVYQTKNDERDENAHVGIDVSFPGYIKKFHVEIRAHRG